MSYKILVVNPGSTSTKLGLFEDERPVFEEEIKHPLTDLAEFQSIYDQLEYRRKCILDTLDRHGADKRELSCIVGRGGILPPISAGGYIVDEKMKELLTNGALAPHASNLGGLLAADIAKEVGIPAYIYDAVTAHEFDEMAEITGMPEIRRYSACHVLNSKAVARKYAGKVGKNYEDLRLIIGHLGGGVTFSVHRDGRIVDSLADDSGSFAPERSGSLPVLSLIDIFYEGKMGKKEMMKKVRGAGGLKALLGTSDCIEIEKRIKNGDEKAKLIYDAMIYQFSKGIGLLAPVLKGNIDAIILTGGLAYSDYIVPHLTEYVGFIAPVELIPGQFENEALALGGLRILRGEETPHRL